VHKRSPRTRLGAFCMAHRRVSVTLARAPASGAVWNPTCRLGASAAGAEFDVGTALIEQLRN